MNVTLLVDGMMCCNCERHVKEALENIAGVKEALADHEKGVVEVSLNGYVTEAQFQEAVSSAGYTFKGISN